MNRCCGLRCTSSTSGPSGSRAAGSATRPARAGDLAVVQFLARPGLLGGHGASVLELGARFPRRERHRHRPQWICTSCGFIYDPAEGDPDGGIPAGTAFEEIPDDWFCPVCGARKKDFELHED